MEVRRPISTHKTAVLPFLVTPTGDGMTTVNAIAAMPIFNFGSPFESLPLRTLSDPALELRNAQGTLIDSNDNWQSSPKSTQIQATGLAAPDSAEPAVLATLPMGNYTAIVRGVGATSTGLVLLEIYPQ